MANHRRERCLVTDQVQLERVNYFSGQLLTEANMTTDQEYFRQKLRRHNPNLSY
jgi:hypothetical protein